MQKRVVIVGGGLAGLAAAVYLARGGCAVTLFERRRQLGGRAITHLRHGFRFNIGPHAVNRSGHAAHAYRELGVPLHGGPLSLPQVAISASGERRFPGSATSLLMASMLGGAAKLEAARLWFRLRRMKGRAIIDSPIGDWLDANVSSDSLRAVVQSLIGAATFSTDPRQSAKLALLQLGAMLRGQIVVDDGWQRIVDALHNQAVSAGVSFVTSSRIVRVVHDGVVRGLELGELEDPAMSGTAALKTSNSASFVPRGTMLPADHVLLAVDPITAVFLVGHGDLSVGWKRQEQVQAACLDVALTSLPRPEAAFAIGMDRPFTVGVHSEAAHLAPAHGAVVHVVIPGAATEADLEQALDSVQPGWRERVVHRRFLPAMAVTNSFVAAGESRPPVETAVRNLYLAGDWVGDEGLLSDAALASARHAAHRILASA